MIYTLVGCKRGERCVIERTEEGLQQPRRRHCRRQRLAARFAVVGGAVSAEAMLTRSYEEAADKSTARREQLAAWPAPAEGNFAWVTPPVLNA